MKAFGFKTYVRDRHIDKISNATTNINVAIYDNQGNLKQKDLWLAVNGTTNGQILLDSTYATGDYYIRTSTNWMRNFIEPDDFVQKITIYGSEARPSIETTVNSYDIQFLPEGGHLVSDISNVIGFKVLDKNGKGVKALGFIYDKDGNELTNFKSNIFGMGKFFLTPQTSQSYVAEVYLPNGTTQKKEIKGIRPIGYNIQVNNLGLKNVIVKIQTNEVTLGADDGRQFRLVIHKNGKLKVVPFQFQGKTEKTLLIPKADLFSDINIITVFDGSDKPIMERLIFNNTFKSSKSRFTISPVKKENDSLVFSIYGISEKKSDSLVLSNLSISVLPETTRAYAPRHNILSANYLKPYVNGTIENPTYYFGEDTRKIRYDLDLLLLTQGWSRYKWNNIFNNTPKPIFDFENGITLQGRVIKPTDVTSLTLKLPKLMGSNFVDIEVMPDKSFTYNNFYAVKDEKISISYKNGKGNLVKPNLILNTIGNSYKNLGISVKELPKSYTTPNFTMPPLNYDQNMFSNDVEILDEVEINAQKKQPALKKFANVRPFSFRGRYYKIKEKDARRHPTLLDVIRSQGFDSGTLPGGYVYVVRRGDSPRIPQEKIEIYLDGTRLFNFFSLRTISSNTIEGVSIDRPPYKNNTAVIRFFRNDKPIIQSSNSQGAKNGYAQVLKAKIGFTEPEKYYSPNYSDYESCAYKYYGTIDWLPNVNLQPDKSELFAIKKISTEAVNFYVEGYDSNGDLVSQLITVSLN